MLTVHPPAPALWGGHGVGDGRWLDGVLTDSSQRLQGEGVRCLGAYCWSGLQVLLVFHGFSAISSGLLLVLPKGGLVRFIFWRDWSFFCFRKQEEQAKELILDVARGADHRTLGAPGTSKWIRRHMSKNLECMVRKTFKKISKRIMKGSFKRNILDFGQTCNDLLLLRLVRDCLACGLRWPLSHLSNDRGLASLHLRGLAMQARFTCVVFVGFTSKGAVLRFSCLHWSVFVCFCGPKHPDVNW